MNHSNMKVLLFFLLAQLQLIHSAKISSLNENEVSETPTNSFLFTFGGQDENEKFVSSASRLDTSTGIWESINTMPKPQTQFCGAVSGGKIYMFGGFTGSIYNLNKSAMASMYDTLSDTYTLLRPMPEIREGCAAAVWKDSVYVAGGATTGDYANILFSMIRYDIRSNQWSTLSPMTNPRRGFRLVELNGRLYAIGDSASKLKLVEVYNPNTDSWSFVASSRFDHYWPGVTVHNKKIYVLSANGFEVYTPSTNLWTTLNPPTDYKYESRALVTMNGKLWAVGGEYVEDNKEKASKAVYTYDPSNDRWTKQRDMDLYRRYHAAFVVNQ